MSSFVSLGFQHARGQGHARHRAHRARWPLAGHRQPGRLASCNWPAVKTCDAARTSSQRVAARNNAAPRHAADARARRNRRWLRIGGVIYPVANESARGRSSWVGGQDADDDVLNLGVPALGKTWFQPSRTLATSRSICSAASCRMHSKMLCCSAWLVMRPTALSSLGRLALGLVEAILAIGTFPV
jgi:hypothetical protein